MFVGSDSIGQNRDAHREIWGFPVTYGRVDSALGLIMEFWNVSAGDPLCM